ncbi:hypothetical protein ACFWJ4_37285 [Kitasatospora sp. NPDC127067]|uniref:hypothetical protein n=1 Tax=Kitasatospora sp. NPDC127067 TaxID=3347126 RepID=UPI0036658269
MTSLHPAATDPSLPGPPGDSAGSSPPPAVPGPPAAAVPVCSIATVVEPGAAVPGFPEGGACRTGPARLDSVPQPRSRYDAEAATVPPADACRRPVAEVPAPPGVDAETEDGPAAPGASDERAAAAPDALHGPDGTETGFVRFGSAAAPSEAGPSVPTQRTMREEPRILGSRRPSPSRRLRRMHPQAAQSGQGATARETAASGPTGTGLPGTTDRADQRGGERGERAAATGAAAQGPSFGTGAPRTGAPRAGALDAGSGTGIAIGSSAGTDPAAVDRSAVDGTVGPSAGASAGASWAEPPLGILIGAGPGPTEALGRPEERAPVRVAARPIRVGRGTCLVVLPSWRPAIAVSVPTDQLLSSTGLAADQLVGAPLTVLMNPAALHDRELELHGWEPGPAARTRRGGRG